MTEATQEASVTTESPPSEKSGLLRGLARLFRHPVETTMKTVRDSGVGVTGVVVTIVILGILAAIGGPPLWRLITDAREHKLNSNLQEAAQVMRDRLTLEPEWMGTRGVPAKSASPLGVADGKPETALLTALVEDLPFTWSSDWALTPGNDNDETIRVEFVADGASVLEATTGGAPPQTDWLLADWRAVRLQAANSDGAWACALIVLRPNVEQAKVVTTAIVGTLPSNVTPNTPDGKRVMDAWLGGIWYDSGAAYADIPASAQHCSPVGATAATSSGPGVWLPENAQTWNIHTEVNTATKAAGRTLSRNL